ncbi:MAG TPA: F0F1 ATP synthase subunit A [Candidatus Saccharimonadales bacterium]
MIQNFAAAGPHIELKAEEIFSLGPVHVTNAVILGVIGFAISLILLFYVAGQLKRGKKKSFLTKLTQWAFEGFYNQAVEVIGDKKLARKIFPLAITMFFVVLVCYWLSVLPGVGSITYNGVPVFRALPADLNFTFALAIITLVTTQIYAVRQHGAFGNIGRYFKNPFKDPISAFEGVLEFIGEFSRTIALSFRLFGNAFAGEVLLILIGFLTSYAASVILPFFMLFELFIGFIQAYVFFVLTLIFTSLAIASHGDHGSDHDSDHSSAELTKKKADAPV